MEQSLLPESSSIDRLHSYVAELCRSERNTDFNPRGLKRAEDWIAEQFADLGYRVNRQEFSADGVTCANVEATSLSFVGNDRSHYIVGAHYDSAPGTPGADDNASAVAVMIETARALRNDPVAARLRFVAYTNEEPPHFCSNTMGSVVHAKTCCQNKDAIQGMICLESLGIFSNEPGTQVLSRIGIHGVPPMLRTLLAPKGIDLIVGNFLVILGNPRSRELLEAFDAGYVSDPELPVVATDFLSDRLRLSDHLAYWDEGYAALMLTNTAMCRNPHYHLPTDTPDKLNYPIMAILTQRLVVALHRLLKTNEKT